ncbi:hypothetical protein E2C01_024153 [Portunus trituberculatus]|uniref:Uncharacterized protein n=1 Tax=Portunus trituberculatus TaxID=210409 RepID=A0A5B7E9T5_PORTR|nr:hypothetical protein [Portunus trituberculatus]
MQFFPRSSFPMSHAKIISLLGPGISTLHSKIIPDSNLDESCDTTAFPGNRQAMRWGFRLWYSLAVLY